MPVPLTHLTADARRLGRSSSAAARTRGRSPAPPRASAGRRRPPAGSHPPPRTMRSRWWSRPGSLPLLLPLWEVTQQLVTRGVLHSVQESRRCCALCVRLLLLPLLLQRPCLLLAPHLSCQLQQRMTHRALRQRSICQQTTRVERGRGAWGGGRGRWRGRRRTQAGPRQGSTWEAWRGGGRGAGGREGGSEERGHERKRTEEEDGSCTQETHRVQLSKATQSTRQQQARP